MTQRSRIPDMPDESPELMRTLDSIDRRQAAAGALSDLDPAATLPEVVAAFNALLATQRTR